MKLNNTNLMPPGGWKYMQPETGFWLHGITFFSLLQKIAIHRANNNIQVVSSPYDSLASEIEDNICSRLNPQSQTEHCSGGVRTRTSVGWTELLGFMKANLHWFASGEPRVTQEEAERRASICATCPLNVNVSGCGSCAAAIKTYRETVIKAQPTKEDAQLRACGVCGCDLKSIVHVPLKSLWAKNNKGYPDWCWQRPEGKNTLT